MYEYFISDPRLSSSAVIEHVRDGSVVRALLLPDYYLVTVMLSGVKVSLCDRTMTIGYVLVCVWSTFIDYSIYSF